MASRVVIWSGLNPTLVGTIIEANKSNANAESRSEIATLPVDDRLLVHGPITGYFRRDWGAPGIPFERNAFRNRPVYNVDLRVQKRFQLGENRRLLFSAERGFFDWTPVMLATLAPQPHPRRRSL